MREKYNIVVKEVAHGDNGKRRLLERIRLNYEKKMSLTMKYIVAAPLQMIPTHQADISLYCSVL